MAILYDGQTVAGAPERFAALHQELVARAADQPAFLARFARTIDLFPTPLGLFAQILTDRGELDLKKGGIFPLVHGIRALALERGIQLTGTLERVRALAAVGVLDPAFAKDLGDALDALFGLRLAARLEKLRLHRPQDDLVRPAELGKLERDLLKEALLVVKELKRRVAHHFRLAAFT